jgi:hypothetical protein
MDNLISILILLSLSAAHLPWAPPHEHFRRQSYFWEIPQALDEYTMSTCKASDDLFKPTFVFSARKPKVH